MLDEQTEDMKTEKKAILTHKNTNQNDLATR